MSLQRLPSPKKTFSRWFLFPDNVSIHLPPTQADETFLKEEIWVLCKLVFADDAERLSLHCSVQELSPKTYFGVSVFIFVNIQSNEGKISMPRRILAFLF